eukprot:4473440-Alexandrium_andersonii.AAC.1
MPAIDDARMELQVRKPWLELSHLRSLQGRRKYPRIVRLRIPGSHKDPPGAHPSLRFLAPH